MTSLWMGPPPPNSQQVAADIQLASAGKTVELGQLLAARSIRYVVVVEALAPDVPGLQQPRVDPPPAALLTALASQTDLRQLPTQGGYEVFDNPEFVAPSSPANVRAPPGNGVAISGEIVLWAVVVTVLVVLRRRRSNPTTHPPGGRGERFFVRGTRAPGPPGSPRSVSSEEDGPARPTGSTGGSAVVTNGSAGHLGEQVRARHTRSRRAVRTQVGSRADRAE